LTLLAEEPILAEEKLDLSQGSEKIPNIRLSEVGTTGLSINDGRVEEQVRKELRWPHVITTYKNMYNDPMINAAVNLIEMMIAKVDWKVTAPDNPTPEQLSKTKFIEQCMGDMEHSWEDFIKEVLSYIVYGFSVNEKVFRYRDKKSGSAYEDNLIGWRKLAPRSQDTLADWEWSTDGRKLKGVYQDLSRVSNNVGRFGAFFEKQDAKGIFIKRDKFLHFRYNPRRDNPLGNSPLNACWLPYKFRSIIEEQEAIGIARDLKGMPILGLHPKYMSPDATDEDKAIYEYYKNVMRNIQNNEQGTLIYPLMYNDQGKKIIEFELMSSEGSKSYDTNSIIKRYDDKILTALFADILKLGQDTHGSFSLAGAKTNIVAVNIEARLKEISSVINNDLVKQTFKLNGWGDTQLPKITYEDLDEEDLDELSKLVQRIAAVGFLPKSKEIVSQIVKRSGFDGWEAILEMSDEEFEKLFPEPTSRSGDGMEEGSGNGTSKSVSKKDNSSSNNENA
jgi:hypothetical protein